MPLKEQRNKDKANNMKKAAKAAESKKNKGVMKDKSANVAAGSEIGVSVPAMEEKMRDYVDNFATALSQIKAGRAVPTQLDDLVLQAHGKSITLKSVASVSSRNANTLLIQIYDPTLIKEVDRAIRTHNAQLNPVQEESSLVVAFPKATKDVRDELVRTVAKRAEETRGHLRDVRQKYLSQLKTLGAEGECSKDLLADLKNQIQASHDAIAGEIKKMQEDKDKEIQQV